MDCNEGESSNKLNRTAYLTVCRQMICQAEKPAMGRFGRPIDVLARGGIMVKKLPDNDVFGVDDLHSSEWWNINPESGILFGGQSWVKNNSGAICFFAASFLILPH